MTLTIQWDQDATYVGLGAALATTDIGGNGWETPDDAPTGDGTSLHVYTVSFTADVMTPGTVYLPMGFVASNPGGVNNVEFPAFPITDNP